MKTLDEALAAYPGAETFRFGDNEELCNELLALVRSGRKTATCGELASFGDCGESLPEVGRMDISLNWNGTPALVIRTIDISIRRFCEVDENFALAEGENETLAGWQADHRRYFRRNGGWTNDMELVCERFALVEDFAS